MKEYYFFFLAFVLGLLWFYKKVKKKQPYHYFSILFVLGLNLKSPPFNLSPNIQGALILSMTGIFMLYDLCYVKKIKGSWRYAAPVLLYGLYFLIF